MNSDKPTGPRHNSSLEMTAVMPRPPLSTPMLAAMDLDPTNPETREMLAQASVDERRAAPTLTLCPGPCRKCPCCHGERMITTGRADAWLATAANIAALDDPPDEVA